MHPSLKFLRLSWLIALAGGTVFFALQCMTLQVDAENRSMQADNSEADKIEAELSRYFKDGDSVLLAAYREDLFSDAGKRYINNLVADIRDIAGTKDVVSLADRDYTFPGYYEDLMVSPDVKTMGIRITLDDQMEDLSAADVINSVSAVAKAHSYGGAEVVVSGLPVQKCEAARLVVKDQKLFTPISLFVLASVLFLITGKLSGVVFPLSVSGITTVWTLGMYSVTGHELNMITSLLAPVILTLSVSTVLHVYLHWSRGVPVVAAARQLFLPCLFASVTTAIGFLSLLLSQTPAVRQFGLFAALGVMLAYVIGFSMLLFGLSLFQAPRNGTGNRFIGHSMANFAKMAIGHPLLVIFISILVTGGAFAGLSAIRVNTDILSFLGENNQVYRDSMVVNEKLTGIHSIEVLISRKDGSALSGLDDLERIRSCHNKIVELADVRHVLSLASFLEDFLLDKTNAETALHHVSSDFESRIILDPALEHTRISVRIDPLGTSRGDALVRKIRYLVQEEMGEDFQVSIAGGFVRVVEESNQLVFSQLKSFAAALVLILMMIGIVFRSVKLMLLSIIPNVIPLIITGAVMGFAGIDLSTGTAMIAGVVIGVAVDDTIHYLTEFRKKVGKLGCDRAIIETSLSSGVALFSTTLALSLGFWVAALGSFKPTVYFAILSGLTMWIALICDVLVLPAFLKLFFSHSSRSIVYEHPV